MTFQQYFKTLSADWQHYLNANPTVKAVVENAYNAGANSHQLKIKRPD